MKKIGFLNLGVSFLVASWCVPALGAKTQGVWEGEGLLLYPIRLSPQEEIGEAGEKVVWRATTQTTLASGYVKKTFQVSLESGRVENGVDHIDSMPVEADYVMAKSYLALEDVRPYYLSSANDSRGVQRQFDLAKNVLRQFPDHPLAEEIHLRWCRLTEIIEFESLGDKGPPEESVAHAAQYLKRFPRGSGRDEMAWQVFRLQHYVYEFEGFAEGIINQAKLYERYLREHPTTQLADQIRYEIAGYYRYGAESIMGGDASMHGRHKFEEGKKFLAKAEEIYSDLVAQSSLRVRQMALVALHDLRRHQIEFFSSPRK